MTKIESRLRFILVKPSPCQSVSAAKDPFLHSFSTTLPPSGQIPICRVCTAVGTVWELSKLYSTWSNGNHVNKPVVSTKGWILNNGRRLRFARKCKKVKHRRKNWVHLLEIVPSSQSHFERNITQHPAGAPCHLSIAFPQLSLKETDKCWWSLHVIKMSFSDVDCKGWYDQTWNSWYHA